MPYMFFDAFGCVSPFTLLPGRQNREFVVSNVVDVAA